MSNFSRQGLMRNGARRGKVSRKVGSQDKLCWDSTHASSRANDLGEEIVWCILAVFAVDPKLTFWLPVYTKKVSYTSRNRRKGYYTDGAPSAKWLWSLMIMHLSMVIPGVGGRGVNSPRGLMWAWSPGFVDICCQFLAQDGGLECFCNFIAEFLRKRPQGFVIYLAGMALL